MLKFIKNLLQPKRQPKRKLSEYQKSQLLNNMYRQSEQSKNIKHYNQTIKDLSGPWGRSQTKITQEK